MYAAVVSAWSDLNATVFQPTIFLIGNPHAREQDVYIIMSVSSRAKRVHRIAYLCAPAL